MPRNLIRFGLATCAAALALAGAAGEAKPKKKGPMDSIWAALNKLGVALDNISSLSDGGVERGAVWLMDMRTGERRRVTAATDLAWPIWARDGRSGYALRGTDLVRFPIAGGSTSAVATGLPDGRLIAALDNGRILALLNEGPLGRLAVVSRDGKLERLPVPVSAEDKARVVALASESRAYVGGTAIEVRRAPGSDTGFDVFLVRTYSGSNLTACGDSRCGQPDWSAELDRLLYIRQEEEF